MATPAPSDTLREAGKAADAMGTAPAAAVAAACPAATCPPALAARADDGKLDIDWTFISEREGGCKLDGYVPAAAESKSGVTVATGVDLGARSEADIESLTIDAELKKKLKPYAGKQKTDAQDALKATPLKLTDTEAKSLDEAVKKPLIDALVEDYDKAVDAANKDGCKRVHFKQLPANVQTAVASTSFQYGSLSTATPNYWKQVTEQRWQDASDNLKKFGDAYPTRRKLEAGLIDGSVKAAAPAHTPAPAPTTAPAPTPAPAAPAAGPAAPTSSPAAPVPIAPPG